MQPAAEAALRESLSPVVAARPIRALPREELEAASARDALVRRLAADRLRDLRDDGLTMGYVARMYDVDAAELESLAAELIPSRSR